MQADTLTIITRIYEVCYEQKTRSITSPRNEQYEVSINVRGELRARGGWTGTRARAREWDGSYYVLTLRRDLCMCSLILRLLRPNLTYLILSYP